ncbi:MAG: glycosyltransferase [Caldilineaceae bacterium]
MRLLFLSNFYPPHALGGYEQWCQEVATALEARGHAVTILTSRYGIQPGQPEATPGVIRRLHLESDLYYYQPLHFFGQRRRHERENQQILRQALHIYAPDAILIWGMWNLSRNLPYWIEQWMPTQVAYFISSYWPLDCDPHTAYWQLPANRKLTAGAKRLLRALALAQLRREGYPPPLRFDHAVCCSQYVRTTLVAAKKLPPQAGVLLGGTDATPTCSLLPPRKHHQQIGCACFTLDA